MITMDGFGGGGAVVRLVDDRRMVCSCIVAVKMIGDVHVTMTGLREGPGGYVNTQPTTWSGWADTGGGSRASIVEGP